MVSAFVLAFQPALGIDPGLDSLALRVGQHHILIVASLSGIDPAIAVEVELGTMPAQCLHFQLQAFLTLPAIALELKGHVNAIRQGRFTLPTPGDRPVLALPLSQLQLQMAAP